MEKHNGSDVETHLLKSALNVSLFENEQLILDEIDDGPLWSMEVNAFNDIWYSSIMVLLYGIVCTGCIVGNLMVIIVILGHRQMRSVVNFCLANLAIADLFVGIFCVLPSLSLYRSPQWFLGRVMCKLFYFVQSLAYSCSIIILTVISLERYVAIRHPMFSRRFSRTCFVRGAVMGGVWIVSTAYSLPLFIAYDTIHVSGSNNRSSDLLPVTNVGSGEGDLNLESNASLIVAGDEFCVSTSLKNAHRVYVIINFVLLYIAPLLLMMCVYAQISVVLWRSGSAHSTGTESTLSGSGPKSIGGPSSTCNRSKSIATALLTATPTVGRPPRNGRAGSLPGELLISVLPPTGNGRSGKKYGELTPKIGPKRCNPALQPDVVSAASVAAVARLRLSVEPPSSLVGHSVEMTEVKVTASNGNRPNKLLVPSDKVSLPNGNDKVSSSVDEQREKSPGDHKYASAAIGTAADKTGTNISGGHSYPSSPVADPMTGVIPQSAHMGSRISLTPASGGSRWRSGSSSFGVGSTCNGESATSGQSPLIARRKVVRLLVAIVTSFAVCMLPHHVRLQWQEWKAGDSYSVQDMYVPPVTSLIFYVNSCLNPLLYALISDRFRKAFTETRLIACFIRILSTVSVNRNGIESTMSAATARDASRRRRARMLTVPVIRNDPVSANCTA